MTENIDYYHNQIALARTEIKNLRQKLSALKHEHKKEIKYIKDILGGLRCASCAADATTIVNNRNYEEAPPVDTDCISYKPIGFIQTTFEKKRGVPRQPSVLTQATGTVVINPNVFTNPEHALEGLEEFSHMWLIFHFHKTESSRTSAKVTPPRLGERRGVFSTRSPHRPCAIGISLVQIQAVVGNRVTFLGVDMVNGTPLLDMKPYVPQYDSPARRPPAEGVGGLADPPADLQLDDDCDAESTSPRLAYQFGIDTASPLSHSSYDDDILSPDIPDCHLNIAPISPSTESPSSIDVVDGSHNRSPTRPDTERGAPDGQERFTPPQSNLMLNANQDGIRIASWINDPPSQRYHVMFTDEALERLHDLIGDRADPFKANIECLLSEDPRSVYVRTRYPDHEYSCVLEDLSISCVFDATSGICTIIAVRNAEELQDN